MTDEARERFDFERAAMRFEQLRKPRPQTQKEIWEMMADFGREQREAGRLHGLEEAAQECELLEQLHAPTSGRRPDCAAMLRDKLAAAIGEKK